MALHAIRVEHARLRRWDPALHVETVRGVGFRPACRCGWKGRVCRDFAQARSEGRDHMALPDHHPPP